ncbi:MAG: helix-turn-helix domain-containing protein [Candidatus Fermentibacteraceae bacterium]
MKPERVMRRAGGLVRHHRRKAGLTQLELADLAGVGKTTVFDIEHGKASVQIDSLLAVMDVLSMRMEIGGPFVEEYDGSAAKPPAEWEEAGRRGGG